MSVSEQSSQEGLILSQQFPMGVLVKALVMVH